jgi:hypothetical protein
LKNGEILAAAEAGGFDVSSPRTRASNISKIYPGATLP